MGLLNWIVALALVLGAVAPAAARSPSPGILQAAAAPGKASVAAELRGNSYYYFVAGRHAESEGDVDGAVNAYKQAAALDPGSAEIRAELGAFFARQDRAREAVEWSEAALKIDPSNVEANRVLGIVYSSLARAAEQPGGSETDALDYSRKAMRHLETARNPAVPDASVDLMLGRLYLKTGETDRALATLRRVAEQEPERTEPISLLAEAYQKAGRAQDARALLEKAVADHPELYGTLGRLYEDEQQWSQAADAYEKALSHNPRSTDIKTRLAVSLLSDGGVPAAGRAAAVLKEVRQQTPTDTRTLYLLAQALRGAGQLEEAETTARQLMAIAPGSTSGAYTLAQVYDAKQQYRRVVDTLEPVIAKAGGKSAESVPLVLMLASAHEELGEFDQALAAFARARRIAPDNDAVDLYELGTLVSARRFDQALERSRVLMEQHAGDQRVVRLRAEALRGAGKHDQAVQLLKDAVAAHPQDPTSRLALSEMYAATRQYAAAVKVLEDATKRFPSDLTVRFQLGSVLERQGRRADAERVFRQVLAKDPLYAPALNYLGYMLADRGERLEESIGLIKRALRADPYNGAYLDSLGWAYFKANRLDLAEENLRKAASQRLRSSAVQDHLGDLLFKLGRYGDAQQAWRRALDGDGEQIDANEINRKIRLAGEKGVK